MPGGSSTALERVSAPRRLVIAVLAALAAFVAVTLAAGGKAEACAPGTSISAKILAHKFKHAAAVAHKASFKVSQERPSLAMIGTCGGGSGPAGGSPCHGCCCFACSAALEANAPMFSLPDVARTYVSAPGFNLLSSQPSAQFRPPRRMS